jgi:hypothetical protein
MALGQPLGAPALVGRRSRAPVLLLRRPTLARILRPRGPLARSRLPSCSTTCSQMSSSVGGVAWRQASQAMTTPPPLAFRGTKVRFAPKPSSIEFWGHLPPCEIGLWASGSKYSVAVKFGPISILKTKHDSFPTRGSNGSLSGHSTSPSAGLQHTTQDTVSE